MLVLLILPIDAAINILGQFNLQIQLHFWKSGVECLDSACGLAKSCNDISYST